MKSKAEALTAEPDLELQSQMSDRTLKMAAEVATEREAREFLRVRCNTPSSGLSTYHRIDKTVKGSDVVLRKACAPLPVIKSLVSADLEALLWPEIVTRKEVSVPSLAADHIHQDSEIVPHPRKVSP